MPRRLGMRSQGFIGASHKTQAQAAAVTSDPRITAGPLCRDSILITSTLNEWIGKDGSSNNIAHNVAAVTGLNASPASHHDCMWYDRGVLLDYRPVRTNPPPGAAAPRLGWALAVLPPLVALLAWPVLFAIFFVMSFTITLMVMTACLFWAWSISERLSAWKYWQRVAAVSRGEATTPLAGYRALTKGLIFATQAVVILSSCPLFDLAYHLAKRNGIRIGWW